MREECGGVVECHKRIIHYVRNVINIPHQQKENGRSGKFFCSLHVLFFWHVYTIAIFISPFWNKKSISYFYKTWSYKYVAFVINDIILARSLSYAHNSTRYDIISGFIFTFWVTINKTDKSGMFKSLIYWFHVIPNTSNNSFDLWISNYLLTSVERFDTAETSPEKWDRKNCQIESN